MITAENNLQIELVEKIFRKHYRVYLSFAWKLCCDYPMAKDIVQDVFVYAINNINTTSMNEEELTKYLFTSVKNRVIDYLRRINVRENHKQYIAEALIFSGTTEFEENSELCSIIKGCIDSLSESQAKVIRLKFYNNHSYEEISTLLGVALSTIHTHIKRGYHYLRLCIGKKISNGVP